MSELKGTEIVTIKENKLTAKTMLGRDGGSIIKFSPDGSIKSVYKKVRLFENQKHFYFESQAKQWLLTLEGYKEIVKFTDLKILKIDHMITNGQRVDNPYYQTDSTGKIIRVVEEVTVYGRTPQGDLAFSRARVIADINGMLTKKIIKDAQYDQTLGEFCDFEQYKEMRKTKRCYFFPVNEQEIMGEVIIMGFALDITNKKAFELVRKHMDECEHEYKKVWSKAYRNAVKAHPAVGKYVVNPTGKENNQICEVGIIQWTTDFTAEELEQIRLYAEEGIINPPEINIESDDDIADITEMDQEELETYEELQPTSEATESSETDEKTELVNYIVESENVLGSDSLNSTIAKFWDVENKPLATAPILTLKAIKTEIDKSLEG